EDHLFVQELEPFDCFSTSALQSAPLNLRYRVQLQANKKASKEHIHSIPEGLYRKILKAKTRGGESSSSPLVD
ncbi:MAG: hypothetical protein PVG06_09285, partial [Desulfobacterales bacterium]